MQFLMGPTVSCCQARPPKAHTLFSLVSKTTYEHFSEVYLLVVLMMAETCLLAEYAVCHPPLFDELKAVQPRPTATVETVAIAAVSAADEQNAGAILTLSTSGETARYLSKYRPRAPIITGKYCVRVAYDLNC